MNDKWRKHVKYSSGLSQVINPVFTWKDRGQQGETLVSLIIVQTEFETLHIWYDNEDNPWTNAQ